MKRIIQVCLGDDARLVGELRYDQQGNRESAAFAYAAEWLASADRFQLDPALPLVVGFQYHKRTGDGSLFHGAFADSEPDGWGRKVIARDHAKRRESVRGTKTSSLPSVLGALDYLLAVDDSSRMGSLRFRDETGIFQASANEGQRRTPPLLELRQLMSASRAVERRIRINLDRHLRDTNNDTGHNMPGTLC